MKIVQAPNPVLSQVAKTTGKVDSSIYNLIEEMKKTLSQTKDPEGVGLAAPQVGKSLRLFIAKPNPKSKVQIFINPEIVSNNDGVKLTGDELAGLPAEALAKVGPQTTSATEAPEESKKLEGCLSLPTIWGEVKREKNVTVKFIDEKGQIQTKTFSGLLATIVQHETDHLNGILFPKRVLEQKGKLYKSKKDKNGEDIFQELDL